MDLDKMLLLDGLWILDTSVPINFPAKVDVAAALVKSSFDHFRNTAFTEIGKDF